MADAVIRESNCHFMQNRLEHDLDRRLDRVLLLINLSDPVILICNMPTIVRENQVHRRVLSILTPCNAVPHNHSNIEA